MRIRETKEGARDKINLVLSQHQEVTQGAKTEEGARRLLKMVVADNTIKSERFLAGHKFIQKELEKFLHKA